MEKSPLILCLETSSEVCSVSISRGSEMLSLKESERKNSHAEVIVQLIDECLQRARVERRSINAVAVGAGPGSYTGLRIATSVAKGICYAYDIPLLAVSSLDNLLVAAMSEHPGYESYIAAIDARRMEVYTKTVNSAMEMIQAARPLVIDENPDEFANLTNSIVVGDGAEKMKPVYGEGIVYDVSVKHSAKNMIDLALNQYLNQMYQDVVYFEPDYLKEVYTTVSKKKLI